MLPADLVKLNTTSMPDESISMRLSPVGAVVATAEVSMSFHPRLISVFAVSEAAPFGWQLPDHEPSASSCTSHDETLDPEA
jgi:hypothetical protein